MTSRWILQPWTCGKAPDGLGNHAELLKALPTVGSGLRILQAVHELICNFWHSRLRPLDLQHWHDSVLYPIYKGKGEYNDLHNWRGVVLLDIFSKLTSRILNGKLIALAERVCSDSESGFRPGRGVADATFLLRRCMTEWRQSFPLANSSADPELTDSLFLLFVDLRKAFDAVPRRSLWQLLHKKAGVPFILSAF